jgi:hypothetical protein
MYASGDRRVDVSKLQMHVSNLQTADVSNLQISK